MDNFHTRSKILEAQLLSPEDGDSISTLIAGKTEVLDDRHEIRAVIFGLRLGLRELDTVNGSKQIGIQLADDAIKGLPIDRLGKLMKGRADEERFEEHEDTNITFYTGTTREEVAKALGVSVEGVREHQLKEQLREMTFDLKPFRIAPGAIAEIITRKEVRQAILDIVRSKNSESKTAD